MRAGEESYRRMLVSQLIKFADPDGNFELVSVEEVQGVTNVRFNLRRHMMAIDGPNDYNEYGEVQVSIRCLKVENK